MHASILRYLDEIANQGSIRKAAKILNISSTSINRQLLNIEAQLGVKLFDRSPEGAVLTPAGNLILEHARKTLLDYDHVKTLIRELRDLVTGELRVHFIDSMRFDIMPRIVEEFTKHYPGIMLSALTAMPEDINTALLKDECDIGISFDLDLHPDLRIMGLKSAPMGVIMRIDHPLATRPYLTLEDLKGYSLVRTADARFHHSYIDTILDEQSFSLKAQFFTNDLHIAKSLITSNMFLGIYTKIGFRKEIEEGALTYVAISEQPLLHTKIGFIISAHKNIDPIKRQFLTVAERIIAPMKFGA